MPQQYPGLKIDTTLHPEEGKNWDNPAVLQEAIDYKKDHPNDTVYFETLSVKVRVQEDYTADGLRARVEYERNLPRVRGSDLGNHL